MNKISRMADFLVFSFSFLSFSQVVGQHKCTVPVKSAVICVFSCVPSLFPTPTRKILQFQRRLLWSQRHQTTDNKQLSIVFQSYTEPASATDSLSGWRIERASCRERALLINKERQGHRLQSTLEPAAMWINNAVSTVTLLLFVVGTAVSQSRNPGKRPSGTTAQPPRRQQSSSAEAEGTSGKGGDLTDECPEPNGYFADAYQCDKYYECRDGAITEKLCPDGMVFNDYSINHEKCDLPFNIDCSQRSERQKPKPSLHCPRQNGYFSHEEANVCDKFYYCVDGKYNMITCPDGLVYNEKTGICTWPDEAKKKGCSSQEVFKFTCPAVAMSEAQQHPRYADPEDCQYFYVCINGETPRRNGCKMGQVFNDASKNCDWPRNVPECGDWYKGVLTDAELEALEHPKPKPRPNSQAATANRRKQSNKYRPNQGGSREVAEEDVE